MEGGLRRRVTMSKLDSCLLLLLVDLESKSAWEISKIRKYLLSTGLLIKKMRKGLLHLKLKILS